MSLLILTLEFTLGCFCWLIILLLWAVFSCFFACLFRTDVVPRPVWTSRTVPSNLFKWFFLQPLVVLIITLQNTLRGPLSDLWSSFPVQLSSQESVVRTLDPFRLPGLIALSPQLEGSARNFPGFPSLDHNLETLTRQQVGAIISVTLIFSQGSGVTVFHCFLCFVHLFFFLVVSCWRTNPAPVTVSRPEHRGMMCFFNMWFQFFSGMFSWITHVSIFSVLLL